MSRSILDLNVNELETVIATGQLPEGVGLQGIETRKDFDRLFKHRGAPKYIAEILIKEKAVPKVLRGGSYESDEIKNRRLELKAVEIEVRKKRSEALTHLQNQIYKRLQALEDGQMFLIRGITSLNEKFDRILQLLEENKDAPQ